ncbi:hypothetical protein SAMN05444170_0999 [Bradyrhizobium erythrophlei]|uniref:Transcriptional coactivator p15 (PC4) C-terminal domain-containing protein n=1 Tax=Bradyrhizobium erythrophlei TaxID=1437360 RepID=A0A1M7T798_9BRAD|nr:hypothetical protein SAMN05444170_0999 [Bradyrhizobium erythrophlei]
MKSNSKTPEVCHPEIGVPATGRVVSEFALSPWEIIRAELNERRGKTIVSIARWKTTPTGLARTGAVFEIAGRRFDDMAKLVVEVQSVLASLDGSAA